MDDKKYVAYCASKNLYDKLPTAINSLLSNTPSIDKIFIIAEDDTIDCLKDKRIEIINISDKKYFNNLSFVFKPLTIMAYYRLILSKLIDADKILYLDIDTLVLEDLSPLWDIDMKNIPICAAVGYHEDLNDPNVVEFNSGVIMLNLDFIRNNMYDDLTIFYLNSRKNMMDDQDTLNVIYKNTGVKLIHHKYNFTLSSPEQIEEVLNSNELEDEIAIWHCLGNPKPWDSDNFKIYEKYRCNII